MHDTHTQFEHSAKSESEKIQSSFDCCSARIIVRFGNSHVNARLLLSKGVRCQLDSTCLE